MKRTSRTAGAGAQVFSTWLEMVGGTVWVGWVLGPGGKGWGDRRVCLGPTAATSWLCDVTVLPGNSSNPSNSTIGPL